MEKEEKYDLFVNPEKYLLGGSSSERDAQLDDEAKNNLIEEFFTVGSVGVPEVEGNLYLKSDGKKAWKKHFFVLRASGLYYCPKGMKALLSF
jgi:amyloid beta A4 precursor protein-binding family B protein 1-interacting protein